MAKASLAPLCALSSLLLAGCDPGLLAGRDAGPGDPAGLEPDPAPEGVAALFDVEGQAVPLPTDLYRADGRLVRPPLPPRSDAEAQLFAALEGRDGWPVDSAVFFPLSGALADDTGPAVARLFDLDTQEAIPFFVELEGRGLRLVPEANLRRGRTYVYALLDEARDAEGEPLEVDPAFARLKRAEPLDDREEEALRQLIAPWLLALEQRGVPRAEVLLVGAFTTTTRPGVRFDLRTGDMPYPSRFLLDDTGSPWLAEGEVDPLLDARLWQYDGFSTTAPVRFAATAPLDPDTAFAPSALRLFYLDEEGPTLVDGLVPTVLEGDTFLLTPEIALATAADYALVATPPLSSAGVPLESGLASWALALDDELLIDQEPGGGDLPPDRPAVRVLAGEDARALEPARQDLAPLRDVLRAEPGGLEHVLHVQPFPTHDTRGLVAERRQRLYDDEVTTGLTDVVVATPAERGLWLLLPNVETIVSGTLTTQNWLDPLTRADRDEGPVEAPVHFVLNVPEGTTTEEPLPVVLFGHGLMTTRELVYLVADFLAAEGFASLAIDFPYHGERSVCLSDNNCPGDSRCSIQGVCVDLAGDPVEIGAVESFWPDGPRVPPTTGVAFIELENLMASRDHVVQALVDLSQTVRVIREADWEATAGYALDGEDIVYLGISLGGILGASLAGVEEHIDDYALNVPGAGLVELMQDSTVLGPQLDTFLEENELSLGSPAFVGFESDAKWAFDPADPVNLAPRPGADKRLLIQMAQGDVVVPNTATYLLGAATGVEVDVYEPAVLGHGFVADPTAIESGRAREDILEFYAGR